MTSEYALLLGFPPHAEAAVLAFRKQLLAPGCVPFPWPGGLLLGKCPDDLRLSRRNSHPQINEFLLGGIRFGLGYPVQHGTSYGLTIMPEEFYHGLRISGLIMGDLPWPDGFLPLVSAGIDNELSGESLIVATKNVNWTKIILKKILLEYPLGRDRMEEALVWSLVEERTLIPGDPSQR
jgi:hypothetical protein